jgi:hypothetical protein
LLLTLPVFLPAVMKLGDDPIWFGYHLHGAASKQEPSTKKLAPLRVPRVATS